MAGVVAGCATGRGASAINVDFYSPRRSWSTNVDARGSHLGVLVTPAEWCELMILMAPRLRDAGVLTFSVDGGVSVTLAPAPPLADPNSTGDALPEPTDPLHDPALYLGGVVPGYQLVDDQEPQ